MSLRRLPLRACCVLLSLAALPADPAAAPGQLRLRPATEREQARAARDEVLAGLEAFELDRPANELCFVGDVDGDGLADLAVVDARPQMCGNDPSYSKLTVRSARTLAPLLEYDGYYDLSVDFAASTGLAVGRFTRRHAVDAVDLVSLRGPGRSTASAPGWFRLTAADPIPFLADVAFVGDLDGDGLDELACLDAWASPSGPLSDGEWTGGLSIASGADGELRWTRFGRAHTGGLGMDACAAGDVNGDTQPDVAVLAGPITRPGERAYVSLRCGHDGIELRRLELPEGCSASSLEPLGDLDGDGLGDYLARVHGEVDGFVLVGTASGGVLDLGLPGGLADEVVWAAGTASLARGSLGPTLLGPVVLGVQAPAGERSLWSIQGGAARFLRNVAPGAPPWESTRGTPPGSVVVGRLGDPARPCAVLAVSGGGFFSGGPATLVLVPLL